MNILRVTVRFFVVLAALLVVVASSRAGVVRPPALNDGDHYYLVFVTDASRDALSSDIADYNLFVNQEAATNPALTGTDMGVQWFAIASTETTNARDNAVVEAGVPIYLLDGTTKVADGFADIWDGTLDKAINLNQLLAPISSSVWTGSTVSGTSHATRPLGSSGPAIGFSTFVTAGWITNTSTGGTTEFPLYALSEHLIIPEPSTGALLLIGCGILAWGWRRRRGVRG